MLIEYLIKLKGIFSVNPHNIVILTYKRRFLNILRRLNLIFIIQKLLILIILQIIFHLELQY